MEQEVKQCQRGDTFRRRAQVVQRDESQAFNITGCTFWFTVKRSRKDADASAVYRQNDNQIPRIDTPNGIIEVMIPATTTATMLPGLYQCDIQIKLTNNDIYTISDFVLMIEEDVTRAI